jgi:hypothetical protein
MKYNEITPLSKQYCVCIDCLGRPVTTTVDEWWGEAVIVLLALPCSCGGKLVTRARDCNCANSNDFVSEDLHDRSLLSLQG